MLRWNPASKRSQREIIDGDELDDARSASIGDENEEGFEEEEEEVQPETGPPLLTPISEDAELSPTLSAWSTRLTSRRVLQYALAVVSSNIWPGAYTIGSGRFFENIYIGWAQKFLADSFSPIPLQPAESEFPSGPEVTEVEDPTPEEEAAWRAAQAEAESRANGKSEEEDEDGDEEDEEAEEGEED
ncbi:unnamed protein product [Protopolystoma xenopodis]|uniref:Radial spokehead-like protein n=1 Tax=Protopolystoma xenopodis TaxID=117903 RepID=A0A448WDH8_9PLAT|nr:unnamed protein product [Protopolystoma xenopodis]